MQTRKYPRIEKHLNVKLKWRSSQYAATLKVISLGGCFLESDIEVNVGDAVTTAFVLPSGNEMWFTGEVLYRDTSKGFGVRFNNEMAEQERLNLAQFIDS